MTAPSVCIVVVNWRQKELTDRCVRSLQGQDYPNARIIVVDNASMDGSAEYLRDRHPDLQLLETDQNLGFAGGCNFALQRIREEAPDFVWLINNDAVAQPDALTALMKTAESDDEIGAVGSVLFDSHNEAVQVWGGGSISFVTGLPQHIHKPQESAQLDYIIGASLLLRWKALQQTGFMDERFFLYWEDVDLCFRLRKAGWKLAIADQSRLMHDGSASIRFQSADWDFHFTVSSTLFFQRHSAFPALPIFVSAAGRLAHRLIQRRWKNARAVWRAAFSGNVEATDAS